MLVPLPGLSVSQSSFESPLMSLPPTPSLRCHSAHRHCCPLHWTGGLGGQGCAALARCCISSAWPGAWHSFSSTRQGHESVVVQRPRQGLLGVGMCMRRAVCPESLNNTGDLSCFCFSSNGLEMETDANICFLVNFLNIDKWAVCIPKLTF